MHPHDLAVEVATRIQDARRDAPGGDATIVAEVLEAEGDIAFSSGDQGLARFGTPRAFLVVDPVDGTGAAAAGRASACVSVAVLPPDEHATLGEVSFGVIVELETGQRFIAERGAGARAEAADGTPIAIALSDNADLDALRWTAALRGRPSLPLTVVLEELVDRSGLRGGYFDFGSAAFNTARIVAGRLDAYVDVGRRVLDEFPETEAAFLEVGAGTIGSTVPSDVAAAALILEEAGGVITHADGRSLASHPALGSSRAEGLAIVAAASAELHCELLGAVDRGMTHLGSWFFAARGH